MQSENAHVPSQQASSTPSAQGEGQTTPMRTYVSDLALLIAQNKLTAKEVAKLDPKILEAVKQYQSQAPKIVPKSPVQTVKMVQPQTFVKTIDVPAKSSGTGVSTTFDLEAASALSGEKVKEALVSATAAVTPAKTGEPEVAAKPTAQPVKPVTHPETAGPFISVPKQSIAKEESQKKTETSKTTPTVVPPVVKPVTPPAPPKPVAAAPAVKPASISVEDKLKQEALELQKKIDGIKAERASIEAKEQTIVREKEAISTQGMPLKLKEEEIERSEQEIEDLEKRASSSIEKQALRKKRWDLEDERQRIERERWDIDQKIESLTKSIEALEGQKAQTLSKEQSLGDMLKKVERQKIAFKAIADKTLAVQKLAEIKTKRAKLETDWRVIQEKKKAFQTNIDLLVAQEESLHKDISAIEAKEHTAKTGLEEHTYELERWKKDVELRKLEQEENDIALTMTKTDEELAQIEAQSQDILHQEKDLKDQIAALDLLIKG